MSTETERLIAQARGDAEDLRRGFSLVRTDKERESLLRALADALEAAEKRAADAEAAANELGARLELLLATEAGA